MNKSASIDMIDFLIKSKADVNANNRVREIPLHLASKNQCSIEILQLLVESKSNINHQSQLKKNVLHAVCEISNQSHYDIIKFLIESKSELNSQDYLGHTVLHDACRNISIPLNTIQLLIESKSSLASVNREKTTPLHYASFHRQPFEIIKCLIEGKADIKLKDVYGSLPLSWALKNEEICSRLNEYLEQNNLK